jgi:hypothetical protein
MENGSTHVDRIRVLGHELALDLQTGCRCFAEENCAFHDQDAFLSTTVPTFHQTSKTLDSLIGQSQRKGHR